MLEGRQPKSFRVKVRRVNKQFPIESPAVERTLGEDFPLGTPHAPPGGPPPQRSNRGLTKEIQRLKDLHNDGALTDEQYERAVDRLLDGDAT